MLGLGEEHTLLGLSLLDLAAFAALGGFLRHLGGMLVSRVLTSFNRMRTVPKVGCCAVQVKGSWVVMSELRQMEKETRRAFLGGEGQMKVN